MKKLKTQFQIDNEKEQRKIAAEFLTMVAEGSSKTAITAFLRTKYGIHSNNTIHLIRIKYAGHVVKHREKKPAL